MALNIQRLNFDPVTGDNASEALMKLDANCQELSDGVYDVTSDMTALQTAVTAAIAALPFDRFGLYAARPAANSVVAGTIYYATDVLEAYSSNGVVWSVLPTSGGELGYAEKIVASSTTSTTAVDITGLTVTCKVGEKPVLVEYGATARHQTGSSTFVVQLVYGPTPTKASQILGVGGFVHLERKTRISGLTPGATYTFKLQMNAASAGTVDVYADATDRPFIRVANT